MRLKLGYSPCPNDTFVFHALVSGLLAGSVDITGRAGEAQLGFDVQLLDIDALNEAARAAELDVAKISYHAYGYLSDDWVLLRSGGALGRGVGPLVVAREPDIDLTGKRVAVPGGTTTAKLLLSLWRDDLQTEVLRYDEIMPAVAAGRFAAGLIIHESRFTYPSLGLHSLQDLGTWWEEEVGHLVPLGAIAARRSLGPAIHGRLNRLVRASLGRAFAQPELSRAYVAEHAQEMDPSVRQRHIDLYVNEHTVDVGPEGEAAVDELLKRGSSRGLFPMPVAPVFVQAEGETSLARSISRG
ncbi:MAG TPA: 1,4-dihydroxy-6-naphthoate synthase [Trueperaceae bacterium]|nr:1,4-dihydroxy-6-naphthoate synthase [Trueperaceae bacterium]